MIANKPAVQSFTKVEEGGYSSVRSDSGNWSSGKAGVGTFIGSVYGCGAPATIAYVLAKKLPYVVSAEWMQTLPEDVYDGMFTEYWNLVSGDDLPAGLDLMAQDFGWNTGFGNAAHILQGVVGAQQDGQIGPMTLGTASTSGNVEDSIAYPPLDSILAKLPMDTMRTVQAAFGFTGKDIDGLNGPMTQAAAASDVLNGLITVIGGFATAQLLYYRSCSGWATDGAGWSARTGRRLAAAINLATGTPVAVN